MGAVQCIGQEGGASGKTTSGLRVFNAGGREGGAAGGDDLSMMLRCQA